MQTDGLLSMATVRGLGRGLGAAVTGILGYKGAFEYSSFGEAIQAWVGQVALAGTLLAPAQPAVAAASAAAASAAADGTLATTLGAVQMLLNSQARAQAWRSALLLVAPAVIAMVAKHYGWAALGWVTASELQAQMAQLTATVSAAIGGLSNTLNARFGRVDESVAEVHASVGRVALELEELRSHMDVRLRPLESDARTSAEGVELLCNLVATSGLLSNASDDALRRLDAFTSGHGGEEARRASPRPLPAVVALPGEGHDDWAIRAGIERVATTGAGSGRHGLEVPAFMRSLLSEPAGAMAGVR